MIDDAQRHFSRRQMIAPSSHHELHARGIGDRHREAAVLGHGEEAEFRHGRAGMPNDTLDSPAPYGICTSGAHLRTVASVSCAAAAFDAAAIVRPSPRFSSLVKPNFCACENRLDKRPAPHGRLGQSPSATAAVMNMAP
jgi:hypothetical protein